MLFLVSVMLQPLKKASGGCKLGKSCGKYFIFLYARIEIWTRLIIWSPNLSTFMVIF